MEPYIKSHKDYVKRANAFRKIIFPSAKIKIILQKKYGRPELAQQTLFDVLNVVRSFVIKIYKVDNAKAFYILRRDFLQFLEDIGVDLYKYGREDKILNLLIE